MFLDTFFRGVWNFEETQIVFWMKEKLNEKKM